MGQKSPVSARSKGQRSWGSSPVLATILSNKGHVFFCLDFRLVWITCRLFSHWEYCTTLRTIPSYQMFPGVSWLSRLREEEGWLLLLHLLAQGWVVYFQILISYFGSRFCLLNLFPVPYLSFLFLLSLICLLFPYSIFSLFSFPQTFLISFS